MKITDPHIHLWDLTTGLYPGLETPSTGFIGDNTAIARSYLVEELLGEAGDDLEIVHLVAVEAIPRDPLAETLYLQALADRTGFPQAIVAAADLSAPDVEALLEREAECRNLRGIRQILNRHDNPVYSYGARDFMADPLWCRNFALLERFGLSFDLQLYPHQIGQAAALIKAHPATVFILNHVGMFVDRTLAGWRQWRDGIGVLAGFDNVMVKISGLGMVDHAWTVESFRPYVLEVLDRFGANRAMFASNFPVDKLFGSYGDLWRAFMAITEDLSAAEKQALFAGNADRVYRI